MAVNDYVLRVKPTAGQTVPKDEVSGIDFTGTGAPTLVDEGSEKAWSITFGTLLKKIGLNMALNGNIDGGGKTMAVRFKMTTTSSESFMPMVGVSRSGLTVTDAFFIGQNGGSSFRGRINPSGTTLGSASIASKPNGVIYTLVYKFVTLAASSSDEGKLWVNTVGRVGTAPDAVSGGSTAFTGTFTDAYINCSGTAGAYRLFDYIEWDGEKTDAECAALADDLRATLDGGASTPIAFTGTIPNQTFTNGQAVSVSFASYFSGTQTPFTYANTGASLAAAGLSLSSAGLLSGTYTGTTVSGVIVTGTDSSSNTANSNAFNISLPAAVVPQGTVTLGTITKTSTTASVPYTYSLSDQTGFEYRLNGGAAVTATASPQSLTGLTANTAYTVEIRAINATGAGTWSAVNNFTTAAAPVGTITITDIANNIDTPWISSAVDIATIMPMSLGSVVVNKTGLSTTAGADLVITDAAITTGTEYIIILKIGTAYGWYRAVAT